MEPLDLLGLTHAELVSAARRRIPRGHGVADEVYLQAARYGRVEPEAFGLSAVAASGWRENFRLQLPEVVRLVEEPFDPESSTQKAVLRLPDGLLVECVRIPMGPGKSTLCVSSQVGCKMACRFCETGLMGLLRSLSAAEIVGQLIVARNQLDWPIRNIVFMGMGEPLDNTEQVIQALRVMNDRHGLNYSQRCMTVCTVGRPDGIRQLGALGWKRLNLSLSLNASTDELRTQLMPVNKKHPLSEVQAALLAYPRRRNFVFAINYCLLPGLNDRPEDAQGVAEFCRPLERTLVNVIPYNPGSEPLTRHPEEEEIQRFMALLVEAGVPVRRRVTKGRSVMAACGQLGDRELKHRVRSNGSDGCRPE